MLEAIDMMHCVFHEFEEAVFDKGILFHDKLVCVKCMAAFIEVFGVEKNDRRLTKESRRNLRSS